MSFSFLLECLFLYVCRREPMTLMRRSQAELDRPLRLLCLPTGRNCIYRTPRKLLNRHLTHKQGLRCRTNQESVHQGLLPPKPAHLLDHAQHELLQTAAAVGSSVHLMRARSVAQQIFWNEETGKNVIIVLRDVVATLLDN